MNNQRLQRDMRALGTYPGEIDGIWGRLSEAGYVAMLEMASNTNVTSGDDGADVVQMAWGAKVSQVFKDRIQWTAEALGMSGEGPDYLMACIAFETGESFSPSIRNGAGSGATGLIQFMPATARGLGTTTDRLAKMTAEDQINYVYRYFLPYKGRLKNLGDVYMAILWPAGIGKHDDWKLWCRTTREITYMQNRGLDVDRDGCITRGEAVSKVRDKMIRGRTLFMG